MISHFICAAYQAEAQNTNYGPVPSTMKCLSYQSLKVVGIKFKTRKTIVYDNLG